MTSKAGDRRQRLRRATHAAHERLDGMIERAGLLHNRENYGRYLQATWAARSASEQALDASEIATVYPLWPNRRVCNELIQDIFDLSHARPQDDAALSSETLNNSQALGVLYVLEGSALGARLLEKQAAAIGMTANFGARHMARQTSQPRAWSEFVSALEETPMQAAAEDECAAAALATFYRYEKAFQHQIDGS